MWARDLLAEPCDLPRHEALRLLALATGRTRSDLLLGCKVSPRQQNEFTRFVKRRLLNEPLQYIEGGAPFGPVELGIQLLVDDRVLIPRPETEYLFEQVIAIAGAPRVIVDLCTGSGNLALALKAHFPLAAVYAVDVSRDAVTVARENATRNNLDVEVLLGDLFDPLPHTLRGSVDVLVANPPYLARQELADVPRDVLFEPEIALVAGSTGEEVLGAIAHGASDWLAPGGMIACEISEFHGERIKDLFCRYDATIVEDLTGRDRYVIGSYPLR